MNKITVESLGRVYENLALVVPIATSGEAPGDVVAALLLIAILTEKQRPWNNHHVGRRKAFLDLVAKLYDRADVDPAKRVVEEGDGHAPV